MSEEMVDAIIEKLDADGDGKISFDEYRAEYENIATIAELAEVWKSALGVDFGNDIPAGGVASSDLLPFIAGACGGVCSRTATSPLERIKLMAQCNTLPQNTTPFRMLSSILKTEGVGGLFAGNFYNCLRVMPYSGIICMTYGNIVKQLPDEGFGWHGRLIAGCVAGGIATICTHPLDTLRMRVSALRVGDGDRLPNLSLSVLYRGIGPTLVTMSLFVGLQQYIFDYSRSFAKKNFSPSGRSPPSHFIASGVMAGVVAQTVIYPLDLLRRRVQLGLTANQSLVSHYTWLSKKGGFKALYSGLLPTYVKVIPAVAVSVTVRDAVLGRIDWS
eukprot:TRINITY_DN19621_c0_g1_i1.p1 TRINITY_DN19621_c0_g1~~TRINITY_DN19621_c0_g1_i1.p1  ORF type:complete len:330 (+),score=47.35 TRINITY_DN19621_c0_g1_i1:268-1257(+)